MAWAVNHPLSLADHICELLSIPQTATAAGQTTHMVC